MKRNEIKEAHEKAVLDSFKKHHKALGNTLKINSMPDPPDAIITINDVPKWIEITDAFFNKALAISITSHAADNKCHIPVPDIHRHSLEPHEEFRKTLRCVITEKYTKASIGKVFKQRGAGILLVGVINPYSFARDLVVVEKSEIIKSIQTFEPRFDEIFLYDVNDHIFHKLL